MSDTADGKTGIRRTAFILFAVALLIYIAFIVAGVLRS